VKGHRCLTPFVPPSEESLQGNFFSYARRRHRFRGGRGRGGGRGRLGVHRSSMREGGDTRM
jgi:hypothetical protein